LACSQVHAHIAQRGAQFRVAELPTAVRIVTLKRTPHLGIHLNRLEHFTQLGELRETDRVVAVRTDTPENSHSLGSAVLQHEIIQC